LGDAPIHVLVQAYSPWSKRIEPLVFWHDYGKGRVVCNTLGHDGKALATPAVRTIIARAVEWAATGKVAQDPGS
jgi:type 1 glutamine amidotransferase